MQAAELQTRPKLNRSKNPKDVLLTIRQKHIWVTGLDEVWANRVANLIGMGEVRTERKDGGVITSALYAGKLTERKGEIVVRHTSHDKFIVMALGDTPDSLLADCANALANDSKQEHHNKHGLVYTGQLRPEVKDEPATEVESLEKLAPVDAAQASTAAPGIVRPRLPIKEVRSKLKQQTVLVKFPNGKEYSGKGPKDECRKICDRISKNGPRYEPTDQLEVKGVFNPDFLEANEDNPPADHEGTIIRIQGKVVSVFSNYLDTVTKTLEKMCKPGSFLVVLIGKNDSDYRIIGSGTLSSTVK